MNAFIDDHRIVYGVEPICKVLPIAPSTYYQHAARQAYPELRSTRAKQDEALSQQIRRVWEKASKTMALVKSGFSCNAKDAPWPDVRWNASCAAWG